MIGYIVEKLDFDILDNPSDFLTSNKTFDRTWKYKTNRNNM